MISDTDKGRVFTVPDDSDVDFSDSESDMYGCSDLGDGGVEHSAQVVQQLNMLPPQAGPATSSSQLDLSDSIDLTSDDAPVTPTRAVPTSDRPEGQLFSATINQPKHLWIESGDSFLPDPMVLTEPSHGDRSSSPLNFDASSSAFEFAQLQKEDSIPKPPLPAQAAKCIPQKPEQALPASTQAAIVCEAVPEQRGIKRKLFHVSPEDASMEKASAPSSDLQTSSDLQASKSQQIVLRNSEVEPTTEMIRSEEQATTFPASDESPIDMTVPPTDHNSTKPLENLMTESRDREDIQQMTNRQNVVKNTATTIRDPRKRVRRVAEAMGFAALGGVAVMSALIATAPAL